MAEPAGSPADVRMHPVVLRFDDSAHERDFRAFHDHHSLPTVRLAGLVGMAAYALFGILDTQIVPTHAADLLLVRLGVVCWIGAMMLLTYRPWFPRVQQLVVCSALLVPGWGLALMQYLAPVPDSFSAMGTMLLLIVLFSFVRVRFVAALMTAGLIIAGYELTLLVSRPDPLTVLYLNFELIGFVGLGVVICHTLERLWRTDFLRGRELEIERARSDALLHNVLPETIAGRLRRDQRAIADSADDVTVLFADIVGFTALTGRTEPNRLVAFLDRLFGRFDELCDEAGAEKIKTIGDGYMAVAGLPDRHTDSAGAIAGLALAMREAAGGVRHAGIGPLAVRIGICSGPVVAGVIGRRRLAYDLWGDTVNTASRLESQGRAGGIQICARTRDLLDERFELEGPAQIELKGKGAVPTWELLGSGAGRATATRTAPKVSGLST